MFLFGSDEIDELTKQLESQLLDLETVIERLTEGKEREILRFPTMIWQATRQVRSQPRSNHFLNGQ